MGISLGTNLTFTPAKPLPGEAGPVFFFSPRAQFRPGQTIDHFKFGRTHGETGWVDSQAIADKMGAHLAQTKGRPVMIEVSPHLLADDIMDGIKRGGVKDDLLTHCRSLFFCSDIYATAYAPNGMPVALLLENHFTETDRPGRNDLFVHNRRLNGSFLKGLDYFSPITESLAIIKAQTQTNDARVVPFLSTLNGAAALDRLLADFPGQPDEQPAYQSLFSGHFSAARNFYWQLQRTNLIGEPKSVSDQALALFFQLDRKIAPPAFPYTAV